MPTKLLQSEVETAALPGKVSICDALSLGSALSVQGQASVVSWQEESKPSGTATVLCVCVIAGYTAPHPGVPRALKSAGGQLPVRCPHQRAGSTTNSKAAAASPFHHHARLLASLAKPWTARCMPWCVKAAINCLGHGRISRATASTLHSTPGREKIATQCLGDGIHTSRTIDSALHATILPGWERTAISNTQLVHGIASLLRGCHPASLVL